MNKIFKYLLLTAAMLVFLIPYTTTVHAASKNMHDGHSGKKATKHKRSVKKRRADKLVILNIMPKSGEAREAGFDGSYIMEPTTILDSDFTLCAKASRGLIMIDNALLKKCGGRPLGWSEGPINAKKIDHSMHSM